MSIDLEALFQTLTPLIGAQPGRVGDREGGVPSARSWRRWYGSTMSSSLPIAARSRRSSCTAPSTPDEKVVYVTLYQAGPYLLDPFYHTARRPDGVFRMRELAPDRFFSSEYYRSYYMQTGLAEEVGFFVEPRRRRNRGAVADAQGKDRGVSLPPNSPS